MVCSRIQPPFSRRVCDKEKDHFKFGITPEEPVRTLRQREPRNKRTIVTKGRSDIIRILPIDFFIGTPHADISIGSSDWLRSPGWGERRNLANIREGDLSFDSLVDRA
jgi:hypothetical protein